MSNTATLEETASDDAQAGENASEEQDIKSFDQLGISEETLQAIKDAGYEEPTPVQAEAIPVILEGGDVVAQAQTGTGKTAAFTIPLIEILDPEGPSVQAVLLAPTRELARQVHEEFVKLGVGRGIRAFAIYGGVAFEPQIQALKEDHVIVATPGRLLDHIRRGNLDTRNIRYFGLDEADEMLSMGFEREVSEIIGSLPEKRRNLLFSATMPLSVVRFADNFTNDPTRLDLSSDSIGATSVRHVYYRVTQSEKVAALRSLLRSRTVTGAIIFSNLKSETFRIQQMLEEEGYAAGVLNGDLPQNQREKTLALLHDEALDFLVATDIAARGIDISWLRSVINYDMPGQAENYIHRTGRTGRAGSVGTAYSLVTPGDISVFHYLHKFFHLRMERKELPSREDIYRAQTDEAIDRILGALNGEQAPTYGSYLAVARRLGETRDGRRKIAQLIAHYTDGASLTAAVDAAPEQAPSEQRDSDAAPAKAEKDQATKPEKKADAPRDTRRSRSDNSAESNDDHQTARDDAPKDAKPRRSRRRRDDDVPNDKTSASSARSESKKSDGGAEDDNTSQDDNNEDAPTAEDVREWIYNNSRGRNRWRSVRVIAKAFDISEEELDQLCEDHELLHRTTGKRQMWKVLKPYPGEDEDSGEAQSDDNAREPRSKSKRSDDSARDQHDSDDSGGNGSKGKGSRNSGSRGGRSTNERSTPRQAKKEEPTQMQLRHLPDGDTVRVKVNVGSKHVNNDAELVNTLAQLAGFDAEDFGRVKMNAESSLIEVVEDYWRDIVDTLNNQTWKKIRLRLRKA